MMRYAKGWGLIKSSMFEDHVSQHISKSLGFAKLRRGCGQRDGREEDNEET